ncbi:hypothetical protein ACWEOG_02100 [Amycolatopsis japonica]
MDDPRSVHARLAEPDYQLVWPRDLFKAEAARLLNHRDAAGWDDRCELLLEDAFVSGYRGGPLSEFQEVDQHDGTHPWVTWRPSNPQMTARQRFLREILGNADALREDLTHRRPYWRQRRDGRRAAPALSVEQTVREFIALVHELERKGYLEKRFGKDCVDDPYEAVPALVIARELGVQGMWPLAPAEFEDNLDLFFDVVELFHDLMARPTSRWEHGFSSCGWHHQEFDIESGRVVYRWRVNKILARGETGYRLSSEGASTGRLVAVTDDARTELVQDLLARDGDVPDGQVHHAIELFRTRGADRNQKRSAVAALALILEERRHNVLAEALAKNDSGVLFEIANKFHIRHQDAKQRRDYDEYYLDWIFWVYLSTVELTNRVIDEQREGTG